VGKWGLSRRVGQPVGERKRVTDHDVLLRETSEILTRKTGGGKGNAFGGLKHLNFQTEDKGGDPLGKEKL